MLVRILVTATVAFSSACATAEAHRPELSVLTSADAQRLRVMTFNIQSGRHGLENVADIIADASPDVVALQEVDSGTHRARGRNQVEELARLAGYEHRAFFPAASLRGGEYGLGILSRHPILSARHVRLPVRIGMEPRAVAHVVLSRSDQVLSVYVTHLSNRPDRESVRLAQARFIARLMSSDPRPRILMGDLNDAPDSAAVLTLRRRLACAFKQAGRGPAETYPLPVLPDRRLDYVLASRELTARRTWVIQRRASDHYPLVADFDLPRTGGSLATAAAP